MNNYDYSEIGEVINIGSGKDISIKELAEIVKVVTGFKGFLKWDNSKPDGTPRKLLNVNKIKRLGWQFRISLLEGLGRTYKEYRTLINERSV